MDAFVIEDGPGGAGSGRYAAGLISLPGGIDYGVESVTRIEVRGTADRAARAGLVAGSFREALLPARTVSLPLRLAFSTMRAGLSVVEEGLRQREGLRVEIAFEDATVVHAMMAAETLTVIRHDAALARGILERSRKATQEAAAPLLLPPPRAVPVPQDPPDDDVFTSIFRYEKRNGRLRRVAASAKADE